MIQQVLQFLEKYNITDNEKTYLIGFSGGYDSMCLLDIIIKLSYERNFNIVALHLNHNWRPKEAKQEEENCRNFCESRGIEFHSKTLPADSKKTETAAREERQKFFKTYYDGLGADGLFLAHTKSDNTETVIYRVIQGTGVNGLCGILEHNIINDCKIYRPLLEFGRDEIEKYCKLNKLKPNHDSSNDDIKYKRNFIRHKIIPKIKELNPDLNDAIKTLTEVAISEQNIIDEYLNILKKELLHCGKIKTKGFCGLSSDVQKKLIMNFLIHNNIDYDSKKIADIVDFINLNRNAKTGKMYSLGTDLWLYVSASEFYPLAKSEMADKMQEEVVINKNGTYKINDKTFTIEDYMESEIPPLIEFPKSSDPYAYVSGITFPMTVRARKDGDVIQPFGMDGSMKLKKFFINKNVPKFKRDDVILLCKEDEVLWASGHCLSEKLRVAHKPTHVIKVED